MKYAPQYIRSAIAIIDLYDASMPLAAFLKNYFAANKKFGSKDRKHIAHLCYSYYRLGNALKELRIEERICAALFLCSQEEPTEWSAVLDPAWMVHWSSDLTKRLTYLSSVYPKFEITSVFPWTSQLNSTIDAAAFTKSHFIQPDLFLRIRPGAEIQVKEKLTAANLLFEQLSPTCLALSNTSNLEAVLDLDKEAVIQDYSSQQIATLFPWKQEPGVPWTVWDCCAASGGKSLLAYDTMGKIYLTVSDIRLSILRNLKKRFEKAGIGRYHSFVADLTGPDTQVPKNKYQFILCDAPCTGSGTWARTPEQLVHFSEKSIVTYAILQKKILARVIPQVASGGYLLYSTCSVFKEENEDMVAWIATQSLQLIEMKSIIGYAFQADTMFAALFQRVE